MKFAEIIGGLVLAPGPSESVRDVIMGSGAGCIVEVFDEVKVPRGKGIVSWLQLERGGEDGAFMCMTIIPCGEVEVV